jgi:hypothetical protein
MYSDILQSLLSTIRLKMSALSFSDLGIQTISTLMLYFKHVLSISRANFCRTVLVLPLQTIITTFLLSVNHFIFLPSNKCINDNSTFLTAVSSFYVELLPRIKPSNHITLEMLIDASTMSPPKQTTYHEQC